MLTKNEKHEVLLIISIYMIVFLALGILKYWT
jgi:hypothetical protein